MGKSVYWVEKYRPRRIDELCGQENLVDTVKRLLKNKEDFPHLLFYGEPGCGKTTAATAIARELYGENFKPHVKYINASMDRKLSNIRDLRKFIRSKTLVKGKTDFKLIILDEADYLHHTAQPALRAMMENQARRCKFILTCNYPEKIIPAIRSRCTEIHVRKASRAAILEMLDRVIKNENINGANEKIKRMIIRASGGDFRTAVNILQSATDDKEINAKDVAEAANVIEEKTLTYLFKVLEEKGPSECIEKTNKLIDRGVLPTSVIDAGFYYCLDNDYFDEDKSEELLDLFADASKKLVYGAVGTVIVPWFVLKLAKALD